MSTIEIYFHEKARREYLEFDVSTQRNFDDILDLISQGERIQSKKFKKLAGLNIYELRVKDKDGIYRIFGTFKKKEFVVLFCYQKKTQKIPKQILSLIMNRYRSVL